ncbi:MAG: hypothetical protein AAB303_04905 [Chloroflexota bacterium]
MSDIKMVITIISDWLPLISVALTLVTLFVVLWQTWLTRRAVGLAERNAKEFERRRVMENLPQVHIALEVRTKLQQWCSDLQGIIDDEKQIKDLIDNGDPDIGVKYGVDSPAGLVSKSLYDYSPPWLRIVLMSAVQYYYNAMAVAADISRNDSASFKYSMLQEAVNRAKEGVTKIYALLGYITEMVPQWFLDTPASIDDRHFFDR